MSKKQLNIYRRGTFVLGVEGITSGLVPIAIEGTNWQFFVRADNIKLSRFKYANIHNSKGMTWMHKKFRVCSEFEVYDTVLEYCDSGVEIVET